MRKPYALTPASRQPETIRLTMARLDPEQSLAFRRHARAHGLSTTAALVQLVEAHALERQPFQRPKRRPRAQSVNYSATLPAPLVAPEIGECLVEDAQAAGITQGEAFRQLISRSLAQG
ncbi:hypothetical protein [Stenotrophomonas maltophilia]|uniref:hypothetical protein n=1 Tax=Stenotrophomonas maltophilia TaxID=40324 RepID=UPI00209AFF44|nr:hypothetical protein [Stenotrophomonas maltophilia]MCO7473055.1 hypothetical protein [Stenotrophomonas maltophilia]